MIIIIIEMCVCLTVYYIHLDILLLLFFLLTFFLHIALSRDYLIIQWSNKRHFSSYL